MTFTVPVRFQGSVEEAAANRQTHCFDNDPNGDGRCYDCDCRPTHAAASYSCGAVVPRQVVAR